MEDSMNNEAVTEQTNLIRGKGKLDTNNDYEYDIDSDLDGSDDYFDVFSVKNKRLDFARRESIAADRLSSRLLAIDDDDDEMEDLILHETLNVDINTPLITLSERADTFQKPTTPTNETVVKLKSRKAAGSLISMTSLCVLACGLIIASFWIGSDFIGPPNQPTGPYQLIERQEGDDFLGYYTFLEGPDSAGSNGYINYVGEKRAKELNIANISYEVDELDQFNRRRVLDENDAEKISPPKKKSFLYLKTAPTEAGPRESIRLEGKKRFDRGLFIIDVRHMPAGCGTWPAFWLTDEANWPVNGEIDILEGVNFQSEAKTALHTSKGCDMFDVPIGTMTGIWDTAVGIPDGKTGIPDMTSREAKNCFVYDPHQWNNQGCVAIDVDGGSIGVPLNEKGGGIFVLEWDPIYRHIRSWAFTPHTTVPDNLLQAIQTANEPSVSDRVMPNPEEWSLPYAYFPIGKQKSDIQLFC